VQREYTRAIKNLNNISRVKRTIIFNLACFAILAPKKSVFHLLLKNNIAPAFSGERYLPRKIIRIQLFMQEKNIATYGFDAAPKFPIYQNFS